MIEVELSALLFCLIAMTAGRRLSRCCKIPCPACETSTTPSSYSIDYTSVANGSCTTCVDFNTTTFVVPNNGCNANLTSGLPCDGVQFAFCEITLQIVAIPPDQLQYKLWWENSGGTACTNNFQNNFSFDGDDSDDCSTTQMTSSPSGPAICDFTTATLDITPNGPFI